MKIWEKSSHAFQAGKVHASNLLRLYRYEERLKSINDDKVLANSEAYRKKVEETEALLSKVENPEFKKSFIKGFEIKLQRINDSENTLLSRAAIMPQEFRSKTVISRVEEYFQKLKKRHKTK
ncbi:Uncharacterised protein [uncultured archaeon]|nr:Uncharacterised protein [uncultured archaeon]